jgi:hypothetical protein
MAEKKIKVIYIGGVEHSGSTLLGLILEQHPEVNCVGELSLLPKDAWIEKREEYCSCGSRILDCPLWATVKEKLDSIANTTVNHLNELSTRFDKNIHFPFVFKNHFIKSKKYNNYLSLESKFLNIIFEASRSKIIVDTSKRVSRALMLSHIDTFETKVIHIVRDSRGVAFSSNKPKRLIRRNWLNSAIRWIYINTLFLLLKKFLEPENYCLLKYEDLITQPDEVLTKLSQFLKLDYSSIGQEIANGRILQPSHISIGNGFIKSNQDIVIRNNFYWQQKMDSGQKKKVWFLTKFLMDYFDYQKDAK